MPPARPRQTEADSRSDSSAKEKINPLNHATSTLNGKRRVAANAAGGSSLRDVITAGQSGSVTITTGPNSESSPGINWTTLDASILHGYRYDYRLNTASAFGKPANQVILSQSIMGRMSPTMAKHKQQRRQSKEQLTNTVRKHFNSFAIAENEVVVDFLYKVRHQDKNFRMRFAPQRPR